MEDREIRAALERHWAASDANDFEEEHQIYREDAVLEYPQSGERIRGRRYIQSSRVAQPLPELVPVYPFHRVLVCLGAESSVPDLFQIAMPAVPLMLVTCT